MAAVVGTVTRSSCHTLALDVFDLELRLSQDPQSLHLGTTVWDASLVLAKWLERNARKGEFSREKLRGKRAIELGAGMGVGGLAFAMLGASVLLTDTADVLPLLARNYEANLSPAALRASGSALAGAVGPVEVRELDWFRLEQVEAAGGPYDYILAADCVCGPTLSACGPWARTPLGRRA